MDIVGSLETEPSVSNQSNIFCIAGDDMFATFSMISNNSPMIHGFSRIYLYSFIMLFTYVILSLFIAIIMDTWVSSVATGLSLRQSYLKNWSATIYYVNKRTSFWIDNLPSLKAMPYCTCGSGSYLDAVIVRRIDSFNVHLMTSINS